MRAFSRLALAASCEWTSPTTRRLQGVLRGLLIRLSDRFSDQDLLLIAEFIDANELGLALEQMADALSERSLWWSECTGWSRSPCAHLLPRPLMTRPHIGTRSGSRLRLSLGLR
jgi:hypothetical protein